MLFVFALFASKNKIIFKNQTQDGRLVYDGNETVEGLVTKDTDGDTVPDWEESFYGTDPLKKETTPGISDSTQIKNTRKQAAVSGELNLSDKAEEDLTETDKFSRELFSTVAALNQAGEIDDATVDTLTTTLAERMQNSTPRKVFTLSDITVTKDNSSQAVKNYNDTLNKIYSQDPLGYTVLDVLSKFIVDENTVNETALSQLDPVINRTNKIIGAVAKMKVPESLVIPHVDMMNALEKVLESVSDIRLYDTDIVVAMKGLSQYQTNTDRLQEAASKLTEAIDSGLYN